MRTGFDARHPIHSCGLSTIASREITGKQGLIDHHIRDGEIANLLGKLPMPERFR